MLRCSLGRTPRAARYARPEPRVADPSVTDATTQLLRDLNDGLVTDERFDTVQLPLGDGLTLLHRR